MSNVTPIVPGPVGPPRIPSFVEAPGRLGAAIRAIRRGVNIAPIPPDLAQEAWQHQHAIDPLFAPGTQAQMMAWLGKLGLAVANAPGDPRELFVKAELFWEFCEPLPAGVWCDETRRSWTRRLPEGKFFPLPGELAAHLEAFAAQMNADRAGCRMILAASQAVPEERVEPDDAEKDAVHAKLQAWRVEQAATSIPEPDREPLPDVTLSDEQLLRRYDALAEEGDTLAGMAAAAIRGRLAAITGEPAP